MRLSGVWAVVVGLVFVLAGCVGPSAKLLGDRHESDTRHRRMDILFAQHGTDPPVTVERNSNQAYGDIKTHCMSQQDIGVCDATDQCQEDVCNAELWLCVAQTALEAARNPNLVLMDGSTPTYDVQPQDAESVVALAHIAQLAVAQSMSAIETGILTTTGTSCRNGYDGDTSTGWSSDVGTDSGTHGLEILASTLAEALHIGEEAADLATETILGIAQRDETQIAELSTAAQIGWFDDHLSRVLAAQTQVGGSAFGTVAAPTDWQLATGVYDDEALRSVGIGVVPRCEEGCTRALDSLRESGVTFSSLVPTLTAPYDFAATEAQLDMVIPTIGANLNDRIGWNAEAYDETDSPGFAASIDASTAELLQAVEQMRYEDIVFTRPRGVSLAVPLQISPSSTGAQRTAMWDPTTLNAPVPPPAMHYITRSRSTEAWTGSEAYTGVSSLRLPILRPERAHLFAFARALASEALSVSDITHSGGSLTDAVMALQSIEQQAVARRALDIEVCGGTNVRVRIFGLHAEPDTAEFRVVSGTDSLRCAVQGNLAGQPCTDSEAYALVEPTDTWKEVGGARASRLHAVEFTLSSVTEETYIVRLRPGQSGGYGAYEAVGGFSTNYVS
ncbi:MAG: hypothetical protein AB7P00_34360, partial [Sandaracinaceae bacterium]